MKKYIGLFIILICLTSTTFYYALALNQGEGKDKNKDSQTKFLPKSAADPVSTVLNINNITSWITADGFMPAIVGGSWNGSFPKGAAAGLIFQEGIVWGGKVDDGGNPIIRVSGDTYTGGTTRLTRIVRVRPDYATGDLTDDAANFFLESNADVTSGQIAQIRAQYAKDWNEWPANLGAPYEDKNNDGVYEPTIDVPGIPGASQTIFLTYDDRNASDNYGSPPIGLRVQEVLWGYAIANPLGNVIFKKVKIIYDGTSNSKVDSKIDSMYVVQWSDPDLGQYSDDYAGSDSSLGMMYVYNSTTQDAIYSALGIVPPAGGYDFLGGVAQHTGISSDSAIVDLKWTKGYKAVNTNASGNPLSTAVYFAAGGAWSDPGFDYNGTIQWYNLMRGYQPLVTQTVFPAAVTNKPAGGDGTFLLSGDPVAGTGQIDGVVEGAGDRRICAVTGPFTLALHDTAEIVSSLIAGIGSNNLTSVSVLKFYDKFAQFAYDNLFVLPIYPPPVVSETNLDGKVLLNWANQKNLDAIENPNHAGYPFEGYNVYQLPSATTDLSTAVKIATFDVVNNVTTILDDQIDPTSGAIIQKPVEVGKNSGISRFITISTDAIRGNVPLVNGTQYYFAVTAYGYNASPNAPFHALESSPVPIGAVPQAPAPGVRYGSIVGDTLTFSHTGPSDGSMVPLVVDPAKTTGDNYKVTFVDSTTTWNLTDETTSTTLLSGQTNQSGDGNYLVSDGILVKVLGPTPAIKSNSHNEAAGMVETIYNATALTSAQYDAAGAEYGGNTVWHSLNSAQTERYYVSAGGGGGTLDRFARSITNAVPYDFKLIFTDTTQAGNNDWAVWGFDNGEIAHVPFQLWRYNAAGDSVRLIPVLYSGGAGTPGVFATSYTDPYFGYAATPWIYWYYDPAGYDAFATACAAGDVNTANSFGTVEYFARMIFGDFDGDGQIAPPGTVVKIITTKPNTSADSFTFTSPAVTNSSALAKVDVDKINVFPNPYYGFNSRETTRAGKYVTFSHLPAQATIRIFDLAGTEVRVINKNDASQFINWDLQNENGYPIASGVYIVYVDMPGIGVTKIIKVAVVQEQQILNTY
jgi:hypothetical protein